jgi:uncharacterized protein
MPPDVLESFNAQYIEQQSGAEIYFRVAGGEPTLLGIGFFREIFALQSKHADGKRVHNAFQTNGVLLDDPWEAFLAENQFLAGVSIDGPEDVHDAHRVNSNYAVSKPRR